jgi:hypothetical protein
LEEGGWHPGWKRLEDKTRAKLIAMAQSWVSLADQAEKNAKTELVYGPSPRCRS